MISPVARVALIVRFCCRRSLAHRFLYLEVLRVSVRFRCGRDWLRDATETEARITLGTIATKPRRASEPGITERASHLTRPELVTLPPRQSLTHVHGDNNPERQTDPGCVPSCKPPD